MEQILGDNLETMEIWEQCCETWAWKKENVSLGGQKQMPPGLWVGFKQQLRRAIDAERLWQPFNCVVGPTVER